MKSLKRTALEYLERGWSVIPISARTKIPPVGMPWHMYQERLPTKEEVDAWWTMYPDANIAIITGSISGLVVVDVEKRSLELQYLQHNYPTPYEVLTGGGGRHLIYSYPRTGERVSNFINKKEGVDLRAEGGYVIAPPSYHPSGRRYEWLRTGSGRPPEYSSAITERYGRGAATERSNGIKNEKWLTEIMQGVEEGGRHDAAARLAGYWLSKGIPADVTTEMLLDWNTKNSPPIESSEIARTVKSVARTQERHASRPAQERRRIASEVDSVDEPFGLLSFDKYMSKYGDTPVKWLIENWIPDNTIAMAVAPPGTYKTWMELALAVSVASGRPFLNQFPVQKTGPVIIVQQEDFHGQVAERLALAVKSMFDFGADPALDNDLFRLTTPPSLPIYLHPHRRLRFEDGVVMEALEEKIRSIRPALVIIDPLYSTGETSDFMVELVNNMWPLKDMRDRYGCSFFIAHHTGKGKNDSTNREGGWGSQFLNAFIETGWQIRRKDEKDTATIKRHFKVREDLEETIVKFDISTDPPYKFNVQFRTPSAKEEATPDILAILDEHGPKTQQELRDITGLNRATISRRLQKLAATGIVIKDPSGTYRTMEQVVD